MQIKKRGKKMTAIKSNLSLCLSLFLVVSALSAQSDENLSLDSITPNSQLALSNPEYLVTAGDIYTLSYTANSTAVTYVITVDSSYTVRISNLGVIDVAGKTFRQFKKDAEAIVTRNYPLSGVQLILTQPGLFRVFVVGEVKAAVEISTWAMARLSSLTRYTTPFASIRNVSIKSSNGRVKNYDLFKAERDGDLSQNPYLRPDDIVTFNRLDRQVSIKGAVERPGIYQLLADENLKDLIESYARGFTPLADKNYMELVRYVESGSASGDKIIFTEADIKKNYSLRNYDVITIPDITDRRPAAALNRQERRITLNGAVRRPGTYNLSPNENLRDLIEIYGDGFTPLADKSRMELVRYVESGSVSGDKIIFTEADIKRNYSLQNYDVITIPDITDRRPAATLNRQERRITLNGAVRRPGTYELALNENLKELIEIYGDGLTPLADKTRMELIRYEGNDLSGERIFLKDSDIEENLELKNYDIVTIPDASEWWPITSPQENMPTASPF
jgi:protein involved in polysaccharide export with SLBB domain